MQYLTKEENKEAYNSYLFGNRVYNQSLSDSEIIEKFKEYFLPVPVDTNELAKYRETIDFTIGADRACYNHDKTAVLMCEMPNNLTLGFTRNLTIVDLKTKTAYNLKYGRGYKSVRNFIKGL